MKAYMNVRLGYEGQTEPIQDTILHGQSGVLRDSDGIARHNAGVGRKTIRDKIHFQFVVRVVESWCFDSEGERNCDWSREI